MDAAHTAFTHSSIAAKACLARYNVAQTNFTAAQQSFKTALTNVKTGGAEAKTIADNAAADVKTAKATLNETQAALEAAQASEATAKQALNQALAARSRRLNKHDKLEVALPADEALPTKNYIEEAEAAFADLASLESFPEPSALPCGNSGCLRNTKNRSLAACSHNIQDALKDLDGKKLKAAKKTFNPEQFGDNADFKAKANEVCDAINTLIKQNVVNPEPKNQKGKAFDKSRRMERQTGKKPRK